MKIVKALVILMGVLIVLGMGLLVYGFVMRVGKAPTTDPAGDSAPLVPLGAAASGFGDVTVALDDGEIRPEARVNIRLGYGNTVNQPLLVHFGGANRGAGGA